MIQELNSGEIDEVDGGVLLGTAFGVAITATFAFLTYVGRGVRRVYRGESFD